MVSRSNWWFSNKSCEAGNTVTVPSAHILGDPGAVGRVDEMFVVKVYCKIDLTVNFHHEHFIDPTNCPWVSEDVPQSEQM